MVYCFGIGQRSIPRFSAISIAQKCLWVNLQPGFVIENFIQELDVFGRQALFAPGRRAAK